MRATATSRRRWRRAVLLALTPIVVASAPAVGPAAAEDAVAGTAAAKSYLTLQLRSEAQARQLVETAILRYVLPLGYAPLASPAALVPDAGPREAIWTFRKSTDAGPQTVILVLAPFPGGGFELYFQGEGSAADLAKIEADCASLVTELRKKPLGGPHDELLSYPLSYVQADRAVAVLKSLGYPVIEYKREPPPLAGTRLPIDPDQIFHPEPAEMPAEAFARPVVVNLIDSWATSLVDSNSWSVGGQSAGTGSSLTGGQALTGVTDAVPQQRLLIVWDERDRASLDELLSRLQREIDIRARQILIEALVIEVDRDRLLDLGVRFKAEKDNWEVEFPEAEGQPFTFQWDRPAAKTFLTFMSTIRALQDEGRAKVLSRPSVLVLDGRQARIKVADEIPFTKEINVTETGLVVQTQSFLTAGIILNLKPRATFDNSEVSMQVETIISSAGPGRVLPETGVIVAPTVQSRQVQTLVRVANDTPFVIGGLISLTDQNQQVGVPGLMKIPLLGRLFRRENVVKDRKEVIIVITPHIVAEDDQTFAYTIPRDNEIFDSFGADLFRNVYRLRSRDIFDVSFIYDHPTHRENLKEMNRLKERMTTEEFQIVPPVERERLIRALQDRLEDSLGKERLERLLGEESLEDGLGKDALETFLKLFAGDVPGEEILVQRMMIELLERVDPSSDTFLQRQGVVERKTFDDYVPLGNVLVIQDQDADPLESHPEYTECDLDQKMVSVKFPKEPENQLKLLPVEPTVECVAVAADAESIVDRLQRSYGVGTPEILLGRQRLFRSKPPDQPNPRKQNALELLQSVLALERMLELNHASTFPRTLKAFHVGREVVFPTREDLEGRGYVIDRRTAELFYETLDFYDAFDQKYRQLTADLKSQPLYRQLKAVAQAPEPEAPAGDVPEEVVAAAVARWEAAWESRDVEGYLGAYSDRFAPPAGRTRPAWEADRRARLSAPGAIDLELGGLELEEVSTDRAVARFEQRYRSERLCDVEQKTLELAREPGGWRIVAEKTAPGARRLCADRLSSRTATAGGR